MASPCKHQHEERYLRLTASNFGRVVLCKSSYSKLAEEILFSKISDPIPSIKWGRIHESDTFAQYLEYYSNDYLRKAGFYVGEHSYLGARPDDIVEMPGRLKMIEIKCPFSVKDIIVEEACSKNGFYCKLENNEPHLNRGYVYYYQCQGSMAITGA